MNCLECNEELTGLVNYDTLLLEFISCPNCKNKMVFEYDETYDGETEETYFWLEQYINNDTN